MASFMDPLRAQIAADIERYSAPQQPRVKQNASALGDTATAIKQGLWGMANTAVGYADTANNALGRAVGFNPDNAVNRATSAIGEVTGFQPARFAKEAEREFSPLWQGAMQSSSEYRGRSNEAFKQGAEALSAGRYADAAGNFLGGVGAEVANVFANPRVLLHTTAQSLPDMAQGIGVGAAARRALPALSPFVAAGVGEGAVMAGQQMTQLREAGVDSATATNASLLTGVLGGATGYLGGRLAGRLGFSDVDTAFLGGRPVVGQVPQRSLKARVAGGAATEGLFEELPQSVMEQVVANAAQGKPWHEDTAHAGVLGAFAGGIMGGAMNIPGARKPIDATQDTPAANPGPIDNSPAAGGDLFGDPAQTTPDAPAQPRAQDEILADYRRVADIARGAKNDPELLKQAQGELQRLSDEMKSAGVSRSAVSEAQASKRVAAIDKSLTKLDAQFEEALDTAPDKLEGIGAQISALTAEREQLTQILGAPNSQARAPGMTGTGTGNDRHGQVQPTPFDLAVEAAVAANPAARKFAQSGKTRMQKLREEVENAQSIEELQDLANSKKSSGRSAIIEAYAAQLQQTTQPQGVQDGNQTEPVQQAAAEGQTRTGENAPEGLPAQGQGAAEVGQGQPVREGQDVTDPARELVNNLLALVKPGRGQNGAQIDYAGMLRTYVGLEGTNDEKLQAVADAFGYKSRQRAHQILFGYKTKGSLVPGAVARIRAAALENGYTEDQARTAVASIVAARESQYGLSEDQQEIARTTGALETGLESPMQGRLDYKDAEQQGMLSRELQADPVTRVADAENSASDIEALAAEQLQDDVESTATAADDTSVISARRKPSLPKNATSEERVQYEREMADYQLEQTLTPAQLREKRYTEAQARRDANDGALVEPEARKQTAEPTYEHSEREYASASTLWAEYAEDFAEEGASAAPWEDLAQTVKDRFTQTVKDASAAALARPDYTRIERMARYLNEESTNGRRPDVPPAKDDTGAAGGNESADLAGDAQAGAGSREATAQAGAEREGQDEDGLTPEEMARQWDAAARAIELPQFADLNAEHRNYILGSANWDEFNEAANEVAAELATADTTGTITADQAGFDVSSNPVEARVSRLRPRLGEKQSARLDKLIGRYAAGEIDLGRLDTELEDIEAKAAQGFKYSEGGQGGSNADTIRSRLRGYFLSPMRFDALVQVVQSPSELPADARGALSTATGRVQGMVVGQRIYLIGDHIAEGQELAVLLHELGVHMGLKGLLGDTNFKRLVQQVRAWAGQDSLEGRLAAKALERAGKSSSQSDEEVVAYFVEEAVTAGIDPTAVTQGSHGFRQWFRTLWAAAKAALRKIGWKRFDQLTAQNVVDLAYGAAQLELSGTWHGTAAQFRRFDHSYMNTGEGAQAFGWGTYLAQRAGIAKGYFEADVRRKNFDRANPAFERLRDALKADDLLGFDSMREAVRALNTHPDWQQRWPDHSDELAEAFRAYRAAHDDPGPDGAMLRVVPQVEEDELLDWDKPLAEQSETVRVALADADLPVAQRREDGSVRVRSMSGRELYAMLSGEHGFYTGGDDVFRQMSKGSDKAASEYLDSIGIKGIKFLDAQSRTTAARSAQGWSAALLQKEIARARAEITELEGRIVELEGVTSSAFRMKSGDLVDAVGHRAWAERQVVSLKQLIADKEADLATIKVPDVTHNLVIFNDKNLLRVSSQVAADRDRVKFSEAAPVMESLKTRALDALVNPAGFAKQHGLGWLTLEQMADVVKSDAVTAYHRVMVSMQKHSKDRIHDATLIDVDWAKLPANDQERLSAVMREATRASFDPSTDEAKTAYEEDLARKYDGLPAAAKSIYTRTRDYYAKNFEDRKAIMLDAAHKANADGRSTKEVEKLFSKVKGPYFPLMRIGQWYSVGMSPELAALQAKKDAGTASAAEEKQLAKLRKQGEHYVTRGHTSRLEAMRSARELQTKLGVGYHNKAEEQIARELSSIPDIAVIEDYLGKGLPSDARAHVKGMLAQMYFDLLPEHSALKRQMKREGVHGEEEDMRRVFAASSLSAAHHISRMKYSTDLSEALQKVKREGSGAHEMMRLVGNELAKRTSLAMEQENNPLVDRVLQVSYFSHLGLSPAFILTNMSQVPMITAPWLGARHGYTKTISALAAAYVDTTKMIRSTYAGKGAKDGWRSEFNWASLFPAGSNEDKLFTELLDRNLLDITMEHDLGAVAEMRNGKLDDAIKIANLPVRVTELANRAVTGLAAYRLAMSKPGTTHTQAVDHAAKALSETQLNYSGLNAARHMQSVLGSKALARLMMQFRKYQQGMVYLVVKNAYDALKDADPATRKVARRTLFGLFATTGLMAGTVGVPFFGTLAMLANLIGKGLDDDDEPFDAEVEYRQFLSDMLGPEAAAAVAKGLPTLIGLDLSRRLGMGDIGSPLPFARQGRTGTETVGNALVAASGASFGTIASTFDGVGLMADGEWLRGAEKIAPIKAAQNMLRGHRYGDEGLTTAKGEVVVPAEKFSAWELALRTAGFQPTRESEYYAANQAVEGAKQAASEARTKLLREYAQTRLRGDATTDIEADIADYNSRHPEKGLRIDASSKLRAVQSRRKMASERNDAGVRLDRTGKRFAEEGRFAAP